MKVITATRTIDRYWRYQLLLIGLALMVGGGVVLASLVLEAVHLHPVFELIIFVAWIPIVIIYGYRLLKLSDAKVVWDIVLANEQEHRIQVVWRYLRGNKVTVKVDGEAAETRRSHGTIRDTREFDFGTGPRHRAVIRLGLFARPRRRLDLEVDGEELVRI